MYGSVRGTTTGLAWDLCTVLPSSWALGSTPAHALGHPARFVFPSVSSAGACNSPTNAASVLSPLGSTTEQRKLPPYATRFRSKQCNRLLNNQPSPLQQIHPRRRPASRSAVQVVAAGVDDAGELITSNTPSAGRPAVSPVQLMACRNAEASTVSTTSTPHPPC